MKEAPLTDEEEKLSIQSTFRKSFRQSTKKSIDTKVTNAINWVAEIDNTTFLFTN